ncbi:MAG: hypothetical protein DRP96_08390 [Candidatus Neomarinimicrobiota bacterium]|nr:MAG: hypothetical protein DRP96_08390 [Candidatus Neomarinimicrobiota bacterium]
MTLRDQAQSWFGRWLFLFCDLDTFFYKTFNCIRPKNQIVKIRRNNLQIWQFPRIKPVRFIKFFQPGEM